MDNASYVSIAVVCSVIGFVIGSSTSKFDGLTAEEWYNEYDAIYAEKMTCEDNYNVCIDERPSEALLELDTCIKDALSSNRDLWHAAEDNPKFTPQQKTQLLFTLADLTTKEKRECTETYLSK